MCRSVSIGEAFALCGKRNTGSHCRWPLSSLNLSVSFSSSARSGLKRKGCIALSKTALDRLQENTEIPNQTARGKRSSPSLQNWSAARRQTPALQTLQNLWLAPAGLVMVIVYPSPRPALSKPYPARSKLLLILSRREAWKFLPALRGNRPCIPTISSGFLPSPPNFWFYMIFYIFQKVWWINRSCPLLRHGFRFLLIFLFPYLYYNKFIKIKKTEEKAGGAVLFPTDTAAKAADLRDKSPAFLTGDGKRKVTSQGRKRPFSGMQGKTSRLPERHPPAIRPF